MEDEIDECIYCNCELNYDDSGTRDTETMGGCGVEYLVCPKCGQKYSKVLDGESGICCEDDV